MRAVIPALFIYLFYQPVMELVTRGRSPASAWRGCGWSHDAAALLAWPLSLIRNVFRPRGQLAVALSRGGLICCFVTRQRVRIGDLAAGTLLVTEARAQDGAVTRLTPSESAQLPLALIELAQELLDRWSSLSAARRRELAQGVLARAGRESTSDLSEQALHTQLRELLPNQQELRT